MFRPDDSLIFQRVTGGLRKPIVRFRLASGRKVELIALHLEPAWAFTGAQPRLAVNEVMSRLYPNEKPVVLDRPEGRPDTGFLCVGYFYSDTPARSRGTALDYSILLVCSFVENLDKSIRAIASEMLAKVDWESNAANDSMW